jgi:hypothetical protein
VHLNRDKVEKAPDQPVQRPDIQASRRQQRSRGRLGSRSSAMQNNNERYQEERALSQEENIAGVIRSTTGITKVLRANRGAH